MTRSKKYWIELFQSYYRSNETTDDKILLDDYDAADYLNMAIEIALYDAINKKLPGFNLASAAIWKRKIPVTGVSMELPSQPINMEFGIITITSSGTTYYKRSPGINNHIYSTLLAPSAIPLYVLTGEKSIEFTFDPSIEYADVLMIPNLQDLEDEDEYNMPDTLKDLIFATARQGAVDKVRMKPNYKNDTAADPPQAIPQRRK